MVALRRWPSLDYECQGGRLVLQPHRAQPELVSCRDARDLGGGARSVKPLTSSFAADTPSVRL
jgi:hypothetical protein